MDNKTLLELIIGTNNYTYFIASCVFALLGIVLSLLFNFAKRDVNDTRTPTQFSLKFLLCDNMPRILVGVICVFVALRFSSDLLGMETTLFASFVIGLSIDNLAKIIQNKIINTTK